jgi:hypothetical protein
MKLTHDRNKPGVPSSSRSIFLFFFVFSAYGGLKLALNEDWENSWLKEIARATCHRGFKNKMEQFICFCNYGLLPLLPRLTYTFSI